MKKLLSIVAGLLITAAQATGCAQAKQSKEQNSMETKKTLVVFFSRADENYAVGNIEKGNTHIIAEMIADETGGELFQIEPINAYPADYTECTEVAKSELERQARPAIKGDVVVENYDVVFIGYPNWWGDMPMPVYTFIEKHDWQGKTVVPFCTHEGSGLSGTENKLKQACTGANVQNGLAVRGATAQNKQQQSRQSVVNWLKSLDY